GHDCRREPSRTTTWERRVARRRRHDLPGDEVRWYDAQPLHDTDL
ncbi:MAG: hypothetical protein AVDCRST_MAG77-328, partial [uncultured Chloroflexi bacterium]